MKNINRASLYYLTRDKGTIGIGLIVVAIGALLAFGVQTADFQARGMSFVILVIYTYILGTGFMQISSMLMGLTAKDKLSNRVEFFVASGIKIKDLILSYSLQIHKIVSVFALLVFVFTSHSAKWNGVIEMLIFFISIIIALFAMTLVLNTVVMTVKRFKTFKNLLFFTTFFFVYIIGNFSDELGVLVNSLNISMDIALIGFNLLVSIVLLIVYALLNKNLNTESIISRESLWE